MFLQPSTEKSIPVTSGTLIAFWGKGLFTGGSASLESLQIFWNFFGNMTIKGICVRFSGMSVLLATKPF